MVSCGENSADGQTTSTSGSAGARPQESYDSEALRDAVEALRVGDLESVPRLVDSGGLGDGQPAVTLVSSVKCDPRLVRFLLEDAGVAADARRNTGAGLVHEIAYPYEDPICGAEELDQLDETLRLVISAGADPCLTPESRESEVPAVRAGEWGLPSESVELLESYASDCP